MTSHSIHPSRLGRGTALDSECKRQKKEATYQMLTSDNTNTDIAPCQAAPSLAEQTRPTSTLQGDANVRETGLMEEAEIQGKPKKRLLSPSINSQMPECTPKKIKSSSDDTHHDTPNTEAAGISSQAFSEYKKLYMVQKCFDLFFHLQNKTISNLLG